MNNLFSKDFQDLIRSFNQHEVEYVLVGGYSVIIHGHNRTTGDMDLWVNPTTENYPRMIRAFSAFGLPTNAITEEMFLSVEKYDVFNFGVVPISIDIMTAVKGLHFNSTFELARWHSLEDGLLVRVIHIDDLIKTKRIVGRHKDLADVEALESLRQEDE